MVKVKSTTLQQNTVIVFVQHLLILHAYNVFTKSRTL